MDILKVGQINYSANTLSDILPIPRDFPLHGLNCYLTLTGNTGSSVSPDPEAPASIIKRIEFIADGESIVNVDGESIAMLPYFFRKIAPVKTINTTTSQTGVVIGTLDFELLFDAVGLHPDILSVLMSGAYNHLGLRVLWGASSDLGTGYTVSSGTLEVCSMPEYYLAVKSPVLKRVKTKSEIITASQGDYKFKLPTNGLYQYVLLKCERGGLPVNDMINRISIWLGGTAYKAKDVSYAQWQANVKYLHRLNTLPDGYVLVDLTNASGSWRDLFNANLLSDFAIELDLTYQSGSTNQLKATYCFYDKYPR